MTGIMTVVAITRRSPAPGWEHATVVVEDGYGQRWGMYWMRFNPLMHPVTEGWDLDSAWAEANAEGIHEEPNDVPEEIARFAHEELVRDDSSEELEVGCD